MSSLIVEVCQISKISPHPNADRLEIAEIKGWEIIIGKDSHVVGDLVVYVPPDAMVPKTWADRFGVTPYLSWSKSSPDTGRVRAARLRSMPSYGFSVPLKTLEDVLAPDTPVGTDVKDIFGIVKYEPPEKPWHSGPQGPTGHSTRQHPFFHKYTDLENWRNFPNMFHDNDIVVALEKIHGENSRIGYVWDGSHYELCIGSHNFQKSIGSGSRYNFPLERYGQQIRDLLMWFIKPEEDIWPRSMVLFGEIYGSKVQDLAYGLTNGERAYAGFDIAIDGGYLPITSTQYLLKKFGIPMAPQLYIGPYSPEILKELSDGPTILGNEAHFREGIVFQELISSDKPERGIPMRKILKLKGISYETRRGGTEYH